MSYLIAPSILSADFARLGEEIQLLAKAKADWVHVDVMDGQFVKNLTIGAPVVAALKKVSPLPLDVHLMIDRPERYLADFIAAGSDWITIHYEATTQLREILRAIRKAGRKAGISLRPDTSVESLAPYLNEVDLVLVMTVEPGFGGQSFRKEQLAKIAYLKQKREQEGLSFLIEIDGGVNAETLSLCKGADVLVAGSFVFKGKDQDPTNPYAKNIEFLKA